MEYKIILANGMVMNTEITNLEAIEQMLDNEQIRALTVGDISLSKNAFSCFVPVEQNGNVEITTTDNQVYLIQDDEYDAASYSSTVNSGKRFCRFGNSIFVNQNYFMARPVE